MQCVCQPTPAQVLSAVSELPYCNAYGCFDVPLDAVPTEYDTISLLVTALIVGSVTAFQVYQHAFTTERQEEEDTTNGVATVRKCA